MRKNNNIIEINGRRYNAKTGAALTSAGPAKAPAEPAARANHNPHAAKPKPAAHRAAGRTVKQRSPHRPGSAHTLMRQAVEKPQPSLKRQSKARGRVDPPSKRPLGRLEVKESASRLDAERLRHAKQISKSRLISHFPPFTAGDIIKVRRAQQPAAASSQTAKLTPPKRPAAQAKHRPKTTSELLDQAVRQATSHLEPPPKQPRRHSRAKRNAGIGAAIALTVLVLGVIVTQNLSNVRLQMAAAKAGLGTSLSSYQYAGFALSRLNYGNGVVSAQFNNSGNSHYSVTQKRSSWDNTTLRNTFVAPTDAHYQTVQAAGRTIYLYGNRNATWVDNGVWYVIQSDGSLSDRQLVDLATSP